MTQCANSLEATVIDGIKQAAAAAFDEYRRVVEVWKDSSDKFVKDATSLWRFDPPCELESGDVGERDG